jgi:hypothetical protein
MRCSSLFEAKSNNFFNNLMIWYLSQHKQKNIQSLFNNAATTTIQKNSLLYLYDCYCKARVDYENPMAKHARRGYLSAINIIEGNGPMDKEPANIYVMRLKEDLMRLRESLRADPDDEYNAGVGAVNDAIVIINNSLKLCTDKIPRPE